MGKGKLIDKLWKFIVILILEIGVFVLGDWLAFRFFPANEAEAIYNAIVVLFIFAVGITIILYGNVAKKRNLNILGFAFFCLQFLLSLIHMRDLL